MNLLSKIITFIFLSLCALNMSAQGNDLVTMNGEDTRIFNPEVAQPGPRHIRSCSKEDLQDADFFVRGSWHGNRPGARLWNTRKINNHLTENPSDTCAKEAMAQAIDDNYDYWTSVGDNNQCFHDSPTATNFDEETCDRVMTNLVLVDNYAKTHFGESLFPGENVTCNMDVSTSELEQLVYNGNDVIDAMADEDPCAVVPIERRNPNGNNSIMNHVGQCVMGFLNGLWQWIKDTVSGIWGLLNMAWDMIKILGREAWGILKDMWTSGSTLEFGAAMWQRAGGWVDGFKDKFNQVWGAINDWIDTKITTYKCIKGSEMTKEICHDVAYVSGDVAITLLTGGASKAAWLGRLNRMTSVAGKFGRQVGRLTAPVRSTAARAGSRVAQMIRQRRILRPRRPDVTPGTSVVVRDGGEIVLRNADDVPTPRGNGTRGNGNGNGNTGGGTGNGTRSLVDDTGNGTRGLVDNASTAVARSSGMSGVQKANLLDSYLDTFRASDNLDDFRVKLYRNGADNVGETIYNLRIEDGMIIGNRGSRGGPVFREAVDNFDQATVLMNSNSGGLLRAHLPLRTNLSSAARSLADEMASMGATLSRTELDDFLSKFDNLPMKDREFLGSAATVKMRTGAPLTEADFFAYMKTQPGSGYAGNLGRIAHVDRLREIFRATDIDEVTRLLDEIYPPGSSVQTLGIKEGILGLMQYRLSAPITTPLMLLADNVPNGPNPVARVADDAPGPVVRRSGDGAPIVLRASDDVPTPTMRRTSPNPRTRGSRVRSYIRGNRVVNLVRLGTLAGVVQPFAYDGKDAEARVSGCYDEEREVFICAASIVGDDGEDLFGGTRFTNTWTPTGLMPAYSDTIANCAKNLCEVPLAQIKTAGAQLEASISLDGGDPQVMVCELNSTNICPVEEPTVDPTPGPTPEPTEDPTPEPEGDPTVEVCKNEDDKFSFSINYDEYDNHEDLVVKWQRESQDGEVITSCTTHECDLDNNIDVHIEITLNGEVLESWQVESKPDSEIRSCPSDDDPEDEEREEDEDEPYLPPPPIFDNKQPPGRFRPVPPLRDTPYITPAYM